MIHLPSRSILAGAVTRRNFLVGVAASGVLVACSGSDSADDGTVSDTDSGATPDDGVVGGADGDGSEGGFTLVQRFPNNVLVPGEIRMPITLSTGAAEFIQDGPASLTAHVIDSDGAQLGDTFAAIKRDVAPAPYYDFRTTILVPGFYGLVVAGGPPDGAAFQVMDPQGVAVPTPGQLLPGFDTPTVGDEQGFDTLCTRTPDVCSFHTVSLTDALTAGRPVVYYVGTPAFCSTGSCAPALESLIAAQDEFGDAFTFVHQEVFADDAGTEIAPAVTAIGMTYEPALFITDATGSIIERLDAVWDETELRERLRIALA